MHDLVGRSQYAAFHGHHVAPDFVEAPSQMLENFCWMPQWLKSISRHYSYLSPEYRDIWLKEKSQHHDRALPPGELGESSIDALVRSRNVNMALQTLRQIHFGLFELTVTSPESREQIEGMNMTRIFNDMRRDIYPLKGPFDGTSTSAWGHACMVHFINGFEVNYYAYLS